MRKSYSFFMIWAFFFLAGSLHAQTDDVVHRIIEIASMDNQTMHHQDILCNRFGGRLVGSAAFSDAADWAAYKFREWGMEVVMDEVGEVPVGFNRGPWFGRLLGDQAMPLHFATPSYTSGTKGVQKGHVVLEPKTGAQFERMKGKLKGAWVLVGGKSKGWPVDFSGDAAHKRDSIIRLNEGIELKNREIWRENWQNRGKGIPEKETIPYLEEPALFYKEMVEAGILGIIQSSSVPITALYDRKNIDKLRFESLPTIPDIKLDEHQYAIIEKMAKERQRFELEFDIRNHFRMGPIKYHNVIGIIPGTEYPDEYVVLSAHLDAFDVASGAVDNGSGVGPTMEAARLIMAAGGKPKRTILIILWAAEEFGLYGSKSWLERNTDKHDKISNMFNRDGGPTVANSISVLLTIMEDFEKICEPLNGINPDFPFTLKESAPVKRPKEPWSTDSGPFAVAGIPVMSFGTADPKGYDFDYGEIWHTERDQYNMVIGEYQEHTSVVTAIVVYGVANLDYLIPREDYWQNEGKSKNKRK